MADEQDNAGLVGLGDESGPMYNQPISHRRIFRITPAAACDEPQLVRFPSDSKMMSVLSRCWT